MKEPRDYSENGLTLEEQLAVAYGAPATGSGEFDDNEISELALQELMSEIDTQTGAPAGIRAQVAASQRKQDKLLTLRKTYPDALPIEALDPQFGAAKYGAGNFVFTNPETGRLTLFDEDVRLFGMPIPGGLGDFADAGPEIAETIGAIGGGIAGAAAGAGAGTIALPGFGTVAGGTAGFVAGEGLGSAAAREAYIGILDYFGETEDNRTGAEQFAQFSTTATLNAFAGPLLSKIWQGVKFVGGAPLRYANNALDSTSRVALQRMNDAGVTNPTLGQATGSPLYNMMEKWYSIAPTSTKKMMEVSEQTILELDNSARNLATKYGGLRTTSEAADSMFKSAGLAKERYRAERNAMYKEVTDVVGDQSSGAKNILEWYQSNLAKSKDAVSGPGLAPAMDYASRMLKSSGDGNLTFDKIKGLRSSISDMLNDPTVVSALTAKGGGGFSIKQDIESLKAMMKLDMDELIESAATKQMDLFDPKVGGKRANDLLKKYAAADAFVEKNLAADGDITFLNKFLKKGAEDAVDALNYTLRGASGSSARIKKLRSLYTPEEFSVVSGYMLGKMGMPKAGGGSAVELGNAVKTGEEYITGSGFSPVTFLSTWKTGLSKEAKDELFRGTRYADLTPALDDLVFTLDRITATAAQMANPSGSGALLYSAGTLGAVASEFGGLLTGKGFEMGLGGLITPAAGAMLFTTPGVVRWMTKGFELAAYNPTAFPQHIRRLVMIAEANPRARDAIMALVQGLQAETLEPIDWQKSQTESNAPVVPIDNEAKFRTVVPKSTADKLLPNREELISRMDSISSSMPEVDTASGSMFEPLPSTGIQAPSSFQASLSPTVVPNDADRELAMRMQGNGSGIAALVQSSIDGVTEIIAPSTL